MRSGLSVAAVLLGAAVVAAQPPGGRGGGMMFGMMGGGSAYYIHLLKNADVQKELKFTDDDKAGIALLEKEFEAGEKKFREDNADLFQDRDRRDEVREKMTKRNEEVMKQLKEVLGDKHARFNQIRLQLGGLSGAMMDPEVRKTLAITEEQTEKQREAGRKMREEMPRPDFSVFQSGDEEAIKKAREEMTKRGEEMRQKMDKATDEILTAEQKTKWKD
ncbi:MAG TPA: hypothetical protein VNC50_15050, partial [Planctomycetia bacterium]|nr:hypothetical protein [Planctomycetia bacterium]